MPHPVYGLRGPPVGRKGSLQEQLAVAFDRPGNLASTFGSTLWGSVLSSPGIGLLLREAQLSPAAPNPSDGVGRPYGETPEEFQARRASYKPITEEEWRKSPSYRPEIPYDEGMTVDRAAGLAELYDAQKVREYWGEKRPITAFIGGFAGQALDPINYIPIAGPTIRAAQVARYGPILGRALVGSAEAAVSTAVFGAATSGARAKFGDDVSFQTQVSDIAMAAAIGGVLGGGFGIYGKWRDGKTAKFRAEAEIRLGTLKRTQEARFILNDAVQSLARDGEVRLSKASEGFLERTASEVQKLSDAYDRVRTDLDAGTPGDRFDPLVRITPDDIEGAFLSRGGYRGNGDLEVKGAGFGLVKILLKHGDLSKKDASARVEKEDVLDFPHIIRNYEPILHEEGGVLKRSWVVEKNGKVLVYGDRPMADRGGERAVVTIHVWDRGERPALSPRKSPEGTFPGPPGDTAQPAWLRPDGSSEVNGLPRDSAPGIPQDTAQPAFSSRDGGPDGIDASRATQSLPENIEPPSSAVNTAIQRQPKPLIDEGTRADIAAAESRLGKPEDARALADQYRVDPKTGAFPEEAELRQLEAEGRLTAEDRALLEEADKAAELGEAYSNALLAAVRCLI